MYVKLNIGMLMNALSISYSVGIVGTLRRFLILFTLFTIHEHWFSPSDATSRLGLPIATQKVHTQQVEDACRCPQTYTPATAAMYGHHSCLPPADIGSLFHKQATRLSHLCTHHHISKRRLLRSRHSSNVNCSAYRRSHLNKTTCWYCKPAVYSKNALKLAAGEWIEKKAFPSGLKRIIQFEIGVFQS